MSRATPWVGHGWQGAHSVRAAAGRGLPAPPFPPPSLKRRATPEVPVERNGEWLVPVPGGVGGRAGLPGGGAFLPGIRRPKKSAKKHSTRRRRLPIMAGNGKCRQKCRPNDPKKSAKKCSTKPWRRLQLPQNQNCRQKCRANGPIKKCKKVLDKPLASC